MTGITHSARRLNALTSGLSAQTYLEIGVEKGLTFSDVAIETKHAVDPHFRFDWQTRQTATHHYYPVPSDTFFASYTGQPFDLVFLDGLHHFEQTLRDLMNVLVHSHERTIILIDDVFPSDVFSSLREHSDANQYRALAGGSGEAWHGDVFKVIFFIHDFLPTLSYATIENNGNRQTLVWKGPRKRFTPIFNSVETISRLTYFDLLKHQDIMHLMPEQEAIAKAIRGQDDDETSEKFSPASPSLTTRIKNKIRRTFGKS